MTLFGIEFKPFRKRAGWYITTYWNIPRAEILNHCNKLKDESKRLTQQAAAENYQLFCGIADDRQKAHQLFAVKDADACQLAKELRVGSHNRANTDAENETVEIVFEALTSIAKVRKFRPYYIDAAGYHARFTGVISRDEAKRVTKLLEPTYRVGNEWTESEENDVLKMVEENELHLWWD